MPPTIQVAKFTPAYIPITLYWKDDVTATFNFLTSAGATVNMTGTWSAAVYDDETDTTAIATPSVTDTNEATGVILMTLTAAQVLALFAGTADTEWVGWYDLIRVDASSKRRTWCNGELTIIRNRAA